MGTDRCCTGTDHCFTGTDHCCTDHWCTGTDLITVVHCTDLIAVVQVLITVVQV